MTSNLLAQKYLYSTETIVFSLLTLWLWLFYRGYKHKYVQFWIVSTLSLTISYVCHLVLLQVPFFSLKTPWFHLLLRTISQLSEFNYLYFLFIGVFYATTSHSLPNRKISLYWGAISLLSILLSLSLFFDNSNIFNPLYFQVSLQQFFIGGFFLALSLFLLTCSKKHFSLITLMIFSLVLGLRYLLYSFYSILFVDESSITAMNDYLVFFDAGASTVLAFIMLIWMQGYERYKTKKAMKKTLYLGQHDPLTGTLNRDQTIEMLQLNMRKIIKKKTSLCIFLLDIKRFKFINETYGLKTGDYILSEIAARLSSSILIPNIVGRLSGDSFLLVTEKPFTQQLQSSLEHIHQLIAHPYIYKHHEVSVSCRIGYCFFPEQANTAETLLKKAHLALNYAKTHHLKQAFFETGMHDKDSNLAQIEIEINHGFTNNEFILYFQPQLNLMTNRLEGVEALIRWQHPSKGLLSPDKFLPYIEQIGLSSQLDNYVLEKSCQTFALWHEKYKRKVTIAINMTAVEFQDEKLINKIQSLLHKYDIPPKYIDLEITENVMMTDIKTAMSTIINLQNMGIKVSIDDFGTGYSSLAYLRELPIDKIKIDRSFITNVTINDSDLTIVKSMIDLSHGLGKRVLAEGVENSDQLELLRNLGCDVIQGYLISKPIPEHLLEKYLKRR